MSGGPLSGWISAWLLASLRVAPVFTLAPPFTLTRVPAIFRALFGVSLAAALAASGLVGPPPLLVGAGALAEAAAREIALGAMFVLALQIGFGALYVAGRTIDIDAGFGLASLIDPVSGAQVPLVGTLLAYAAGAMFFAMDGHLELLRMFAASFHAIPLGSWSVPHSAERLAAFLSLTFVSAFGVAGGTILVLFLIDASIALISRTVPQMNVLVLGFQVKSIALFLILPASFGMGGVLILRLMTMSLRAIPGLL